MRKKPRRISPKAAMNAISLYAKPSATFAAKLAHTHAVLTDACERLQPITQASSLGVEDMVITHLLHTLKLDSEVFVLQTGKLHAETLALLATVQTTYGTDRVVRVYEPDAQAAADFVAANGEDAMYKSIELRKACCDIRKMVPLDKALEGKKAWITGLRREQSNARAEVKDIEQQDPTQSVGRDSRAKVNPLADWTTGDVWHYISTNQVPYNALHDQFYPSIGCAPCTRAVTLGEDFRSGRWWWENESAKECGLHVDGAASSVIPIRAVA
jgi:phosphoadenosine phosphosulfate reductase